MRIEVLVDVKTILGEGPLWDVEEQRLYWIDSFDGRDLLSNSNLFFGRVCLEQGRQA